MLPIPRKVQGALKVYESVRNVKAGKSLGRPRQRPRKPRDHPRVVWRTELPSAWTAIHLKGSPWETASLGGKERKDCGSHRFGLWSQIWASLLGEEWSPSTPAEVKLQLGRARRS